MAYKEFIQDIVKTRGQWGFAPDDIYEIHHILPKCLGGLPNKIHTHTVKHPNLIWLTPEEHYLAHKLLAKEYPNNKKIIYAFWKMSLSHTVSAEDYALAKSLYSKARQCSTQSEAANKKRAETMKNHKLIWYTNGEIEIRATKCPDGFKPGRSEKIKENNSIKCKARNLHLFGEKNGMYGKHHTDESNKKRSEWTKARHWYNNGQIEVFEKECPEGYVPGRIKHDRRTQR